MIAWLAQHGPLVVLMAFFAAFVMVATWAYAPRNKGRFESYAKIPLKESQP